VSLPTELLDRIVKELERLAIPYHVGGSFASSAHGMYRASADIDFVIDPTSEQLQQLTESLAADFYVSQDAATEALSRRSAFNAIHLASSFKLDFFIKGNNPFDEEELRRSITRRLGGAHDRPIAIKSAEDTILRKLQWFRDGAGTSDRQWQDVLSILQVMRGLLDEHHLDQWALELDVHDLLQRARSEAEGGSLDPTR
jgi:hypothetical protein